MTTRNLTIFEQVALLESRCLTCTYHTVLSCYCRNREHCAQHQLLPIKTAKVFEGPHFHFVCTGRKDGGCQSEYAIDPEGFNGLFDKFFQNKALKESWIESVVVPETAVAEARS